MVTPKDDWIFQLYVEQQMRPKLQPEDFYYENGRMVMTEQYHRKRGYCCGSGCRHCAYKQETTEK